MQRIFTLLIAASTVALSVVGCGSDDTTPSGGAGASGVAQCKGDYAAFDQDGFDAVVDPAGACASDSDRVVECSNDVTKKVTTCGSDCFMTGGSEDQQNTCVKTCIARNTTPSLSDACIDCYAVDVACTRAHCAVLCGVNPTSAGCSSCRVSNGCASDFYACSGLPAPGDDGSAGASGN